MTFTVPVIGDAHFRSDARQPDRLASVAQIISECRTLHVGCWMIPGDLYDAQSDIASRNSWVELIRAMAAVAPVVIAYGNHDRDGDLNMLGHIRAPHTIRVIDHPQVVMVNTPQGVELAVFVLPYPHPAGLVAAGTPPSDVVATARMHLDAIFMDAAHRLIGARAQGCPTLMVGHANVAGSRLSTGQPLIGQEIELDPALLARLGDCPKLLSHIHLPQEQGGATMVGSITAMTWGETEQKRYVRANFTEQFDPDAWQWTISSHPLRTPQLVLLDATFADMTLTYHPVTLFPVPPGADLRVRVRFQESERQFFEYGRAQVVRDFEHVRRLDIEPICEKDTGLRSPEVAAATTLPDKVRAWAHHVGLKVPAPEDLDLALADLEEGDPDAVIAAFTTRMARLREGA